MNLQLKIVTSVAPAHESRPICRRRRRQAPGELLKLTSRRAASAQLKSQDPNLKHENMLQDWVQCVTLLLGKIKEKRVISWREFSGGEGW